MWKWFVGIAVVLVVASLVVTGKYEGPCKNQKRQNEKNGAPIPFILEENNQRDNYAQECKEEAPWWVKLVAWPDGITALALILTLAAIAAQASLMKEHAGTFEELAEIAKGSNATAATLASQAVKQSELTQRQMDLANRPWLCFDSIRVSAPIRFSADGACIVSFDYQVRNVGRSVAQHIQLRIEPMVSGVNMDLLKVRESVSNNMKRPATAQGHGKLVFPTQVLTDRQPMVITSETVAKALDNSPFRGDGDKQIKGFGLEVFVCLDYQSTLDPTKHHQTQNCYLVGYMTEGTVNGLFYPNQTYPASGIVLTFKGFGAYAD